MNTGTRTARSSPPSLAAVKIAQTPDARLYAEFQDLCIFAMDQALEIENASFDVAVCLNSCLMDICKNAFFAPVLGNLSNAAAQALASCVELQVNYLTLLIPGSHRLAGPSPSAEELAHCMDIAIGERFIASGSAVASRSRRRAQPEAEVSETDMDIAIGARKMA